MAIASMRDEERRDLSNPVQQIENRKGHVLVFSEVFRSLIQTFEMLLPVASVRQVDR